MHICQCRSHQRLLDKEVKEQKIFESIYIEIPKFGLLETEVEFVHPISAGGSVKFLPAV